MDTDYEKLLAEIQRMRTALPDAGAPDAGPDLYGGMRTDSSAGADFTHGTPEDRVLLGTPEEDPNAAVKAAYRKMAARKTRSGTPDAGTPDITAVLQSLLAQEGP